MEDINVLTKLGIDIDTINKYQVICLPENIDKASEQSELYDAGESLLLSKLLKEQGVNCANSYDIGLEESKTLERRGWDIWLGVIWVRDNAALPMLTSVLGRLLGEKIQRQLDSAKEVKISDSAKVHADVKILDGKVSASIKYEGDASTFLKLIQGISNNEK